MRGFRSFHLVVAIVALFLIGQTASAQVQIISPSGAQTNVTNNFTSQQTFTQDAASTNTPLYPIILTRTTTGTAAIAMGSGTSYVLENDAGANKTVGSTEFVWADPVSATEDADFVVKTMTAGAVAAEAVRVTSLGVFTLFTDTSLNRLAAGVFGLPAGMWFQNSNGDSILNANYTNATAAMTNVAFSKTLKSGRGYAFDVNMIISLATATDGVQIDFNGGTATVTAFGVGCSIVSDTNLLPLMTATTSVTLAGVISSATLSSTNRHIMRCTGAITPSSNGTFIMRAARITAGTLTIFRGSSFLMSDVIAQ